MGLDLLLDNLLSPPILFFFAGMLAVAVRSDLAVPESVGRLLSIYLLWAIGFKGGIALRAAGLSTEVLEPLIAAVVISSVVPLALFPLLKKRFGVDDACAIAAAYGSVSAVTFITAANFLDARGVAYGGQMAAALALMESPAIIVALVMRGRMAAGEKALPMRAVAHEALTAGPVFLLLASLAIGYIAGPDRSASLKPFANDIFYGVLVLFLLDAGIAAARRMRDLVRAGWRPIVWAIVLSPIGAALGIAAGWLLDMSVGDTLLLAILSASASYIAVPAAMRLTVPNANPGIYLPMALGVTFPINVAVGIPLYLGITEWALGG